jgi:nucleotide-binding universal stress UspA family protein
MNPDIKRILVGLDGSPDARRALEWAIVLGERFDAEVLAVHAVGLLSRLWQGPPVPSQAHLEELRRVFETDWCAPLTCTGGKHRLLLEDGPPSQVLLQIAQREQVDVIVVGSRGEGGFAELSLGSTSHQLAEHSRQPVLIVVPEKGRRNGS